MPNNRHRRVARLRTPEERERYALKRVGDLLGVNSSTLSDAMEKLSSAFRRAFKKVNGGNE
ncbi:hypothetical protein [Weissella ceti]|uniref:Uncharacterized protein n=1 Tax=Weissella ceti TaxID=759620 RepID=A0A088GLE9_9LACO|nr:hypothetical protein [Weissella ceti]AIM63082.1 hypothetical protein WS74_0830 [Weissella ceti]